MSAKNISMNELIKSVISFLRDKVENIQLDHLKDKKIKVKRVLTEKKNEKENKLVDSKIKKYLDKMVNK